MHRLRPIIVTGIFLAIAFAAGYVPQEIAKRRMAERLETAELDLRLANLHRLIGVASHEARRNNYASAADAARAFFDGCRAVAAEYEFEGQPRTHLALKAYGSTGDVLLGQLATGDPASQERLASLYLTMHGMMERRQ
ncbi:MAG TPA: hypothetical protein VEK57_16880 [Thermoanaerobaculia bacterium]|nr:hypothetical protein [Thermoanaerobaculia bacterium]